MSLCVCVCVCVCVCSNVSNLGSHCVPLVTEVQTVILFEKSEKSYTVFHNCHHNDDNRYIIFSMADRKKIIIFY